MKFIRFVFPFLFARNWDNGVWEFSRSRLVLFCAFLLLCIFGLVIAYVLQRPVVYVNGV